MSLLRPCVEAMTPYVPGKQPAPGARVIKLNTNENPYPPSPAVARAIARELKDAGEALRRYSDPNATALREAAAAATGFPLEGIIAGNGSDELLALIMRAAVEPGQTVQYPEPTYVLYETLAAAADARVVTVPFDRDFGLPEALFGSSARVTFIASPGSPSGNSQPIEQLRRLSRSLPEGLLVIDEAYAEFARQDALALAMQEPNVIVTRTLSKSYSLAGLRVGLLFTSSELARGIRAVKDSYNLDRLALVGATAALDDRQWMKRNVERVRTTRDRLGAGLARLGFDVLPSEANFVFARLGNAARARATFKYLEEAGILVRYFDRPAVDDGIRITVGTDAEIDALLEALERRTG